VEGSIPESENELPLNTEKYFINICGGAFAWNH